MHVAVETLQLKTPFRISGYTFETIPVLLVEVAQGNVRGRGEASGVYYFNDDTEKMARAVERCRSPIEDGVSRTELRALMPAGGGRNAVDCALWDLEAKLAGLAAWQLAGLGGVTPLVTTFTLGAEPPESMAASAIACQGTRALKLKLSGDVDLDVERVRAVRAVRPDVVLSVDANQGYMLDSLERLIPALVAARVVLLEQPLPRGRESDLDDHTCPIPLAADESVQTLSDIEGLIGRFDAINVKLDKCGGLTEALLMIREGRRVGLKTMVGNMMGSSLAMAPAFVAGQLCDYVDLDGPTLLAQDRQPSVTYERGTIWCSQQVWG